ncbi:MAG: sigma-70 family RNA polymerase sigma factor [Planctomycetota bacterium]
MSDDDQLVRLLISERRSILAYTQSIVLDRELAEDIYQNVAVVVLRKKDKVHESFEGESQGDLLRWVLRVARLEALTALRKRRTSAFVFSEQVLDVLDETWKSELAKESSSESEVSEALRTCLRRLTDRGRKILELRYSKGLSGQSLAAELGAELNTAYVALSRIHKQLRSSMSEQMARSRS